MLLTRLGTTHMCREQMIMGQSKIANSIVACLALAALGEAAEFTFTSHVASGSGSANVYAKLMRGMPRGVDKP